MKVAILFFVPFSWSSVIAQDIPKKIEIGFGGGANYSFMNAKHPSGKQIALPGFQFGLGAKLNLSKKFFLTGQVSYIKQSVKYSSGGLSAVTFENTYSFAWMAMPIRFNYLVGDNKAENFFFGFGLSPRRLLSSMEESYTIWNNGAGAVSSSSSANDITNPWNLFASVQTGVRFSLKQGGLILLSISYEQNLFDLRKTIPNNPTYSYVYDDSSAKMNSLSLGISYFY